LALSSWMIDPNEPASQPAHGRYQTRKTLA